jgi:O-antigen/teichoic acid export membrane protein
VIAKRISKNFIYLFSGNTISQVIVFYGLIRVANLLTPEDFGRFSFAQAIATFFVRLTEFGLETTAVRRITQRDNDLYLVENVFFIRTFFSVFVLGSAFLLHMILSSSKDIEVIVILLISLIGISLTLEWYYQAHERMAVVGIIRTVRALFFVVPVIVLSNNYHSDIFVSWLYSLSFISIASFFIFFYIKKNKIFFSQISVQKIVLLIKESAPIGVSITLMQIPFYYSTFIIGVTMNKSDVGAFSAAYRPILAFWSFGVIAAYHAFFPVINSLVNDKDAFEKILMKLTKLFVLAGMSLFLIIAPFGKTIIHLLYGENYSGTEYIMQLSLVIISIVLGRAAIEYSLLSLKMQKEYLRGMILVSSLYIVLCYCGSIVFGIIGVVIASIVSELIYTGYVLSRMKIFHIWKDFVFLFVKAIILCTSSYIIFIIPCTIDFSVKLSILFLVFAVGLWISKILTKDEFSLFMKLFRR